MAGEGWPEGEGCMEKAVGGKRPRMGAKKGGLRRSLGLASLLMVLLVLAACGRQAPQEESLITQATATLTLINADTDSPITGFDPIPNGAVLNLQTLPTQNLNVRANVGSVGSVRFALDGDNNYRTENNAPYALEGNSGSDYFAWTPSLGPTHPHGHRLFGLERGRCGRKHDEH